MFPVDSSTCRFDADMVAKIQRAHRPPGGYRWRLEDILPQVLCAGEDAGCLTAEGALLLDPTGTLQPGIPVAPPEGGRGHRHVRHQLGGPPGGNTSAGTSVFAMVVLEKPLSRVYPEIDLVTTPHRPGGGHGSLQQLYLGYQRLGGAAAGVRRAVRPGGVRQRAVHQAVPEGNGGRARLRRPDVL